MLMGTPCQQSNPDSVTYLPPSLLLRLRALSTVTSPNTLVALFTLFPLSEIIVRRSNVRKRFDLQNATDGTCTATLAPSSTLLC